MKKITGKITGLIVLLLSIALAPINGTMAQIICEISIDTPPPVCPDIYFELSVFEESDLIFNWQKKEGNTFTTVGNESVLGTSISDSTVFRVIVIDTIAFDTCISEPMGVSVHQQINIEFDQLQLTCTNGDELNGNSAKVRAIATGEFQPDEYHYFWDVLPLYIAPGDSSLAIGLKAHQYYMITVRDNYGCPKTDTVWTKAYDNPEVEIYADPDTAYLQNPFITFSYVNLSEDSIPITNHFWWFQDTIPDPDYVNTSDLLTPTYTYGAVGSYDVVLTVYNQEGCDTTFSKSIDIKPVKLYIPNVFTPGTGDNINEYFVITDDPDKQVVDESLSKFYVNSHLVVFNRMGRTVFESENYDNKWDGDNLPDGVYYFVLECHGVKSTDIFKGSVTIIRGN
jgi:PKD repeat protein